MGLLEASQGGFAGGERGPRLSKGGARLTKEAYEGYCGSVVEHYAEKDGQDEHEDQGNNAVITDDKEDDRCSIVVHPEDLCNPKSHERRALEDTQVVAQSLEYR